MHAERVRCVQGRAHAGHRCPACGTLQVYTRQALLTFAYSARYSTASSWSLPVMFSASIRSKFVR